MSPARREQPHDLPHSSMRTKLPDYELVRRIGAGSYGEVWLSRSVLGQWRAVKIIQRDTFLDAKPFAREFQGIQRFEPISRSHPSQLHILHVGKNDADGFFYYVMELADPVPTELSRVQAPDHERTFAGTRDELRSGRDRPDWEHGYTPHTLQHDLETRGHLPVSECLEVGLSLATALAHLHEHGLVHRDIKPSNVLFVDGVPKLGDIGLVAQAGDTRSIVGTEGYLPPEGPGTVQADLFSLGKVLYEISTGRDRREFPQLPLKLRQFPDWEALVDFNEVLLKACEADARRRYHSAKQLLADLQSLQQGKSIRHKRIIGRLWPGGKTVAIATVLTAAVLGAALIALPSNRRYPQSRVPEANAWIEQGNHCVLNLTEDRLTNAAWMFGEAIKLDPTYLPGYWGLFRVCNRREAKDSPELRAVAAKLKDLDAGSAEALVASSLLKWNSGDFQGGLADARSATHHRAYSREAESAAHIYYGHFLLETGKPQEAIAQFRVAQQLEAHNPFVYQHLGCAYLALRNFDVAWKCFERCLVLEPRHYTGYFWKGRIHEERGEFVDAIDAFVEHDRVAGRMDEIRSHYYERLRVTVQKGGAAGYWKEQLDCALGEPHQNPFEIAQLYARLGYMDQAYASLEKACAAPGPELVRDGTDDLLSQVCWNPDDTRIRTLASRIGLLP